LAIVFKITFLYHILAVFPTKTVVNLVILTK
jgi:hypothetical protein